jgi:ATP-dependent Lon protease
VNLVTGENTESEERARKQIEYLAKVRAGALGGGIQFNASFDGAIHDRSIVTDTGWKLILGRGLDIFQHVTGDAFDLATRR